LAKIRDLDELARSRDQSLAQMAVAWTLRAPGNDYALIGARKVSQIQENVAALNHLGFSESELARIEAILRT